MPQIRRLAIVNRGEPAMRALAAVAELNAGRSPGDDPITTIVVHTDPDAGSWCVREADEAVPLCPSTYVDPANGHRKSRYPDEPYGADPPSPAGRDSVWARSALGAGRAALWATC